MKLFLSLAFLDTIKKLKAIQFVQTTGNWFENIFRNSKVEEIFKGRD